MIRRVLLDSNVVVDLVLMRVGFVENAERIFEMIEAGTLIGCISSSAVTDVHYIVEKKMTPKYAWEAMEFVYRTMQILPVTRKTIRTALDSGMEDFEDAVQAATAANCRIDIVVTRDEKGFRDSGLRVYSPEEFLKTLE